MPMQYVSRLRLAGALGVFSAILMLLIGPAGHASAQATPPVDVRAQVLDVRTVLLTWSPAAADPALVRYSIRRNDVRLAIVEGNALSYVDASAQPGTEYTYRVRAIVADNDDAAASSPLTVRTPALPDTADTTPPSAPEALTATLVSGQALLDWYPSNDDSDITAYLVRRDGLVVAVLGAGTLSHTDAGAAPGATYVYSVEALDVVGQHSPPSNSVEVTLP